MKTKFAQPFVTDIVGNSESETDSCIRYYYEDLDSTLSCCESDPEPNLVHANVASICQFALLAGYADFIKNLVFSIHNGPLQSDNISIKLFSEYMVVVIVVVIVASLFG